MQLLFLCLATVSFASIEALDFSCRDQNNKPVDWFAFYKIGRLTNMVNQDPHIKNGTGFLYLDANNKNWTLSPLGMESGTQAIGYTLQQYYDNRDDPDVTSIFWNDEFPYPQNATWSQDSGHSKGLFAFDMLKGFWLTHSIPKFPRNDTYDYPSNAHMYGQMGICISLPFEALSDIATQLYFIRPFIHSANLPTSVASQIPLLGKVIAGEFKQNYPFTNLIYLQSIGGKDFYHFAKAQGFGKDLYFDLVAPSLRVALKTETWQHGTGNLFSWCQPPNPFQVFNVKAITLPFDIKFTNYWDHSKFAVATDPSGQRSSPWVCIGDINRQEHQMVRGGGTMCVLDNDLYDAFFPAASEYYECKPGD